MSGKTPSIMVVTGETSGDQRAAEVFVELRRLIGEFEIFGVGGGSLRAAGADIITDISETALFGTSEIISSLLKLKRLRKKLLEEWRRRGADIAFLVDYGGFNLRLAKKLKRQGARILYYVSPQVWASRPGRIRWVKRYVDLMLVLFDFEEELYRKNGVETIHVGHPLIEKVAADKGREDYLGSLGFDPSAKVVGLMPGSRDSEIRTLLPPILEASDRLRSRGYTQQIIVAAPGREKEIEQELGSRRTTVIKEDHYSAMAAADLLIMASGTAALEAAILGVPAVVVYRASLLTSLLARLLMTVKYVSLPNIILGEEVYPELLQSRCNAEAISAEAALILENSDRYDRIRRRLIEVKQALGEPGAAARAAHHVVEFLGKG
ncbi:MAG TPA: lipid-A-disaccharide synthase [Acidobacteriota bacterium]|nr:lipid-A-disaccharide synthase [Acidobacteriota bacterium]